MGSPSARENSALLAPHSRRGDKTPGDRVGKENRSWKWVKSAVELTRYHFFEKTADAHCCVPHEGGLTLHWLVAFLGLGLG